jgi:hypothetical protein
LKPPGRGSSLGIGFRSGSSSLDNWVEADVGDRGAMPLENQLGSVPHIPIQQLHKVEEL